MSFLGLIFLAVAAPLLQVLHLDFNTIRLERREIERSLDVAAAAGYNAVLWEVEDKIRWETCPEVAHPEAFSKGEFREILAKAKRLGLKPIPLLQTFGHAEYVLEKDGYRSFREQASEENCYCVSKPEVREFLRQWIREYLDLFGEDVADFHLGGDEAHGFGTCRVCARRGRMELYAEHLVSVSADLRKRGIRPGIWCDMILAPADRKETGRVPRDFTVWHWDYGCPDGANAAAWNWSDRISTLTDLGFDVIFAASAASWGDGPFMPSYSFHLRNIEAATQGVREGRLRGLCLTSWSVRQGLKSLQHPIWTFAAQRMRDPSAEPVLPFGLDRKTIEDLTAWDASLIPYDGRDWYKGGMKNARIAPEDQIDRVVERLSKRDESFAKKHLAKVAELESRIGSALRKVPSDSRLAEGARLSLMFLSRIRDVLERRQLSSAPIDETAAYLRSEQTPASADHSARMLWSILSRSPNLNDQSRCMGLDASLGR